MQCFHSTSKRLESKGEYFKGEPRLSSVKSNPYGMIGRLPSLLFTPGSLCSPLKYSPSYYSLFKQGNKNLYIYKKNHKNKSKVNVWILTNSSLVKMGGKHSRNAPLHHTKVQGLYFCCSRLLWVWVSEALASLLLLAWSAKLRSFRRSCFFLVLRVRNPPLPLIISEVQN